MGCSASVNDKEGATSLSDLDYFQDSSDFQLGFSLSEILLIISLLIKTRRGVLDQGIETVSNTHTLEIPAAGPVGVQRLQGEHPQHPGGRPSLGKAVCTGQSLGLAGQQCPVGGSEEEFWRRGEVQPDSKWEAELGPGYGSLLVVLGSACCPESASVSDLSRLPQKVCCPLGTPSPQV